MRITESPKLSSVYFDSFSEYIRFVSSDEAINQTNEVATNARSSGLGPDIRTWYVRGEYHQERDLATDLKLASSGWKSGRESIAKIADILDITSHINKPEVYFDVVGNGGINIGRFVTGEPECMMDWRETEERMQFQSGPIVSILVNITASAAVDKDNIIMRGAAICALVDALEASGRRVSVDGVYSTLGKSVRHEMYIPIKHADESLQQDQLAFALTHPDMLRRLCFIAQCNNGIQGKEIALKDSGMGRPANPEFTEQTKPDMYLPAMLQSDTCWTRTDLAVTWIRESLENLGVTLRED